VFLGLLGTDHACRLPVPQIAEHDSGTVGFPSARTARNSPALEPTTCLAMTEEDAWPRAQARTSWAKSVTLPPFMAKSTVTVDPQSLEWAVAEASGWGSRPILGISPASSKIRLL